MKIRQYILGNKNLNLPVQLVLTMAFLAPLAMVGILGYCITAPEQLVSNQAYQLLKKGSQQVKTYLNEYLSLPHQINEMNVGMMQQGILDVSNLAKASKYFNRQLKTWHKISRVGFHSSSGFSIESRRKLSEPSITIDESRNGRRYTYITDDLGNPTKLIASIASEPLKDEAYMAAVRNGKPLWSRVLTDNEVKNDTAKKEVAIRASYPVYNRQGRLLGVASVDLLLNNLSDFLSESKVSSNSQIFILERKGLIVANSNQQENRVPNLETNTNQFQAIASKNLTKDLRKDLATEEITRYVYSQIVGSNQGNATTELTTSTELKSSHLPGKYFIQVTPWQDQYGLDWLIVVAVPSFDVLPEVERSLQLGLFLYAIACLISILISVWMAQSIGRSIGTVVSLAKAIARRDWHNVRLEKIRGISELRTLSDAFNDMVQNLKAEFTKIEHAAYHDALTGLLNRISFNARLQRAIDRYSRNRHDLFAIMFIDLDYFKLVNDTYGHLVGDHLLVEVTKRLRFCLRSENVIARFGGDEFVVLLNNLESMADVLQIADRLIWELRRPFRIEERDIAISASIGIVSSTNGGDRPEMFLRNADIALYRAKHNGKSGYEVFDHNMHAEQLARFELEANLKRALERREFELHYQPIINTSLDNQIVGFEVLMRWQHPSRGMLSPDQFINIIEETGLITEIGNWVLRRACRQMKVWQQHFSHCQSMILSINLSSKQFFQPDCIDRIEHVLQEMNFSASSLQLEITEDILMEHEEATAAKLRKLKSLGIQFSIDDFGRGYSSLVYLHRFPAHAIKIDRSFISKLKESNEKNLEIIEAIVALAQKMGMNVIAEGVETVEQLEKLKAMGCKQMQGYLFSAPVPAWKISELLANCRLGKLNHPKLDGRLGAIAKV